MLKRIVKIGLIATSLLILATPLAGCATLNRCSKSISSDFSGGLNRKVDVYSYDGKLLRSYEGQIDIAESSINEVWFDMDGKRYIITNAIVITEEKK